MKKWIFIFGMTGLTLAFMPAMNAHTVIIEEEMAPGTFVESDPPTERIEVATACPGPEAAYFWAKGHWKWEGQWVWVPGNWISRPHPGAVWVPGHWEKRHHHHGWWWVQGHWD